MVFFKIDVAGVRSSGSGVEINTNNYQATHKHYNVTVEKNDDLYTITAEQPSWDCFLYDEYNPEVVDKVIDKYVRTTDSCLFGLIPEKRYVRGWCEYKDKRKVTYITNNITIKQD